MKTAVRLLDINKSFGSTQVLRGVTIETFPGEVVALYGRSGSGKTTLVNLAGGLDKPDSGTVEIHGIDLSSLSSEGLSELRRCSMGFIFQSYGLLSHLTALDNVLFGLRLAGIPRQAWKAQATQALEAVGLGSRARHWPAELSGGERQRVAVARVLAIQPKLVLADEPTGALDHATGLLVIDLLLAFARETGASVWIATHDAAIAQRVDRAYEIRDGRLAPKTEVIA